MGRFVRGHWELFLVGVLSSAPHLASHEDRGLETSWRICGRLGEIGKVVVGEGRCVGVSGTWGTRCRCVKSKFSKSTESKPSN